MSQLNPPVICIIADKHDLYDDRAYWKQALSLLEEGFLVHYIVVNSDESNQGVTKEGVSFYLIKRKQYIPSIILNYLIKKAFLFAMNMMK
ncbi:hypothetical protein [Niabella ginsengisoli]|uniref:Uncharacterized protein n=1 Tax=Niabella ginsengisoli TaxID=522298 RepID=A0ABS9SM01_9BACT|nr:hypothetical protein [Niabella ginsengisoli]MCH5599301.1 hypothetical protein [Niabella ginsengisoli]